MAWVSGVAGGRKGGSGPASLTIGQIGGAGMVFEPGRVLDGVVGE
jgi:hypothetical protein